jgi:hypothetical protein
MVPFLVAGALAANPVNAHPERAVAIMGAVVSAESAEPLEGVTVELLPPGLVQQTDAQGRFRFAELEPGRYEVRIRRVGFRPLGFAIEVSDPDDDVDIGRIPLEASTPMLEGVVVEAGAVSARLASAGFYARRDVGAGAFIERAEIEEWTPRVVSDALRHVPGVRVQPNPNYGRSLQPRRSALGYAVAPGQGRDLRRLLIFSPRAPGGQQCPPLFYVDGVFLGDGIAVDIDQQLDVAAVEAVEFYAGTARIPPRYNRPGAVCGVFLFWTRVGGDQ